MRNEKFMTLKDSILTNSLRVADYTQSKLMNLNVMASYTLGLIDPDHCFKLLSENRCVANLMCKQYVHNFSRLTYTEKRVLDKGYVDYYYDVNDILRKLRSGGSNYYGYRASDFMINTIYSKGGILLRDCLGIPPINLSSRELDQWVVLVHESYMTTDEYVQDWRETETLLVKIPGAIMRKKLKLDSLSLHYWRVWAMMRMYPDAIPVRDKRINGIMDGKKIAIAGHIINLLIMSEFCFIDMYRHMLKIENNINSYIGNGEGSEKMLQLHGWAAEKYLPGLWHNYHEYYLAVMTYNLMCDKGLFKWQKTEVEIIMSFIRRWEKIPILEEESSTAKEISTKVIRWDISLLDIEHLCMRPVEHIQEKARDTELFG
jgi:hypothetical protein